MTNLLAFSFWFLYSARLVVVELLFYENPSHGTLFSACVTAGLCFAVLVLFMLSPHDKTMKAFGPWPVKLMGLFVLWSGLSVIWGGAHSWVAAFGYWAYMVFGNYLAVAVLFKLPRAKDISVASLKGFASGAVVVAVVALFTRQAGDRLGDTAFFHPNSIGNYLSIGALISIFFATTRMEIKRNKLIWGVISVFILAVFLMSLSKASIIAFSLACPFLIIFSGIGKKRKIAILSVVFIVVSFMVVRIENHVSSYLTKDKYDHTARTLSGRTILWEQARERIEKRPWIGHGIMSFRDVFVVPHAHNEWLTIWYSYGAVGLGIVCSIYFSFLCYMMRNRSINADTRAIAILAMSILVLELVRGFAEADSTATTYPLGLMMLFCYWMLSCKNDKDAIRV